jgi:hypothetical protein
MASGGSVKIWFPRSVLAFRAPLHSAETLLDRNVDRLILATARLDDELPRLLRKRGVAHVLALRTAGESPSAHGDDEVGGYLAVRHLVDLGHRDLAVVTGPSFTSSGLARLAGARKAMDEACLSTREDWLIASPRAMASKTDTRQGNICWPKMPKNVPRPYLPPMTTSPWASWHLPTAPASRLEKTWPWSDTTTLPARPGPHPALLRPRPAGPDCRHRR